ncbi:hypothetical protein ABIC99_003133 [Sphaerotilus sulfidivorans]|uniref:Transposase IS111A/IS1328/IS1533 N-terminal domain-containing protein n=1 Tax=Sphaerotilus sulfidivorans TaxID=639200 RepID=A0ABV2IQS2_9BURK
MTEVFLGIDLAKNVFVLHGVDATGKPCLVRPQVRRDQLAELVARLPPCAIGMEACSGTRHAGRCGQDYQATRTDFPYFNQLIAAIAPIHITINILFIFTHLIFVQHRWIFIRIKLLPAIPLDLIILPIRSICSFVCICLICFIIFRINAIQQST